MLPREKLTLLGHEALADEELLAVLLGSGIKGKPVFTIAREVLSALDSPSIADALTRLKVIRGIGQAKTTLLIAAYELFRRRIRPKGIKISEPGSVYPLVSHLACRAQEHVVCINLNGAHEVLSTRIVTVGLLNFCHVHPREIFAEAITERAAAIVLVHNHPSGSLEPSKEDLELTRQIKEAGSILGIKLLDHVIISENGFMSFQERGLL